MKSHSTDTSREPAAKRSEAAVPSRAPVEAAGPAKVLNEAGAMGNQAFQRRAKDSQQEGAAASAAPEPATAAPATEDPEAILERLGEGRPIDTEVRRRMEAAFGEDFSDVRLHDDATAGLLASDLDARAFTVGEHVAFGGGELQPGTVVGDAIIAHELAHVMQQREGSPDAAKDGPTGSTTAMEEDAEVAAGNAVSSLWSGGSISPVDPPKQRSGLRLSRCNGDKVDTTTPKSVSLGITKLQGSTGDTAKCLDYANKKVYNQANVEVKGKENPPLDETKTKATLGGDLILDEHKDVTKPTTEEQNLLKVNPVSGGVAMYFVQALSDGNRAEAFPPLAGVGALAGVVGNKGDETSFSHELGHILLDAGQEVHSQPDDENLMYAPAGAKNRYKLTPGQIKKVRDSSVVK